MIELILKSYLTLLVSIVVGAVSIFLAGSWFIFKKRSKAASLIPQSVQKNSVTTLPVNVTTNDMRAIAGDDMMSTQLDLARAFIEAGKKTLAKQLLEQVLAQGSETQQQEARQLSGLC